MTKKVYGQHLADAKQLLAAAKAIQADVDACGLDSRKPDPERLRLLEAVAEAARLDTRVWLDYMSKEMTSTEYLAEYGYRVPAGRRAVLEALAALEALDEKETP